VRGALGKLISGQKFSTQTVVSRGSTFDDAAELAPPILA
jgi:hypothetical protein